MENSAVTMMRESTMKHGWHQAFNNSVHHCQTPYDVALILQQVSNCDVLLKEQMSMEKVAWMKQNNVISDAKRFESKSCATAKEHVQKGH